LRSADHRAWSPAIEAAPGARGEPRMERLPAHPPLLKGKLGQLRYAARVLRSLGGIHPRHCPCCGYAGKFRAFGFPPRFDAECPACGALERHRLFVLVTGDADLVTGHKDVLHIAPERPLRGFLRARARTYVTADLAAADVDRQENIEALTIADAQFDVVVCSHVLEHVDDARALGELRRVLRDRGIVICMVPIIEGWDATYEDASVRSPATRDLHFGQHDHVRFYGQDFRARLGAAGFRVDEFTATGPLCVKYGLLRGEKVFVCTKIDAGLA